MTNENSLSALKRSMEFERNGRDFYEKAVEKTSSDMARAIFETLMKQEVEHLQYLMQLYDVMKATDKWPSEVTVNIEADFKLIFKEALKTIDTSVKISTDETQALDFAMNMELKGMKMYKELSEKALSPEEKKLYSSLSEWEKGHAEYCENYLNFFQDNGMHTEE